MPTTSGDGNNLVLRISQFFEDLVKEARSDGLFSVRYEYVATASDGRCK